MRLTNKILEELEYEGRQTAKGWWTAHYVWDDLPGFGVRVTPNGHKTFVLKYRNAYGKQRFHKIGAFPDLSASTARKEAEQLRELVRQGGDPKEQAAERKLTFTVRELGEEWLAKHARPNRKSWETDESRLERHVNSRWGKLAAPEVTKAKVATMHREISAGENMDSRGGHVEANRALQLVHTVYAWALDEGLLPAGTENPAKGIRKFPEGSRKRWVKPHEMPWLLDALDKHEDPFVREAFWLILHTGARKREALNLQWRDVDVTGREVTFRETKNGNDHTIPLPASMLNRLAELPRVEGNPHVFVGYVEGQQLTDVRRSWKSIRANAAELAREAEPDPIEIDLSDVTIHDLRRTVGAWLATAGYSELLIGRILNHTAQSVTGIYARLGDDAMRDALESHARRLQACREPDDGKVVQLRRGADG